MKRRLDINVGDRENKTKEMGFIVRSNCPLPLLIRYATLLVSLQAQAVLGIHLQLLLGVAIADKGTVVDSERGRR